MSLDAWKNSNERTAKLNVLAQVVKYHLAQDRHSPLTMMDNGKTLTVNDKHTHNPDQYLECDHIVIYAAFPSSNQAILDTSTSPMVSYIHLSQLINLTQDLQCLQDYSC